MSHTQKSSNICRRCGRKLKNPEAIELGFGAICYKKYQGRQKLIPLFETVKKGDSMANTKPINNRRTIKMPKTKTQLVEMLKNAFIAGCNHGYAVSHEHNVHEQEELGASEWVGEITDGEMYDKWNELRGG